jgi:hypothetical protein
LSCVVGFQLLHAVYILEKLLQDLISRKCQFQIVCFDQNESLCIPIDASRDDYHKYALARSIIFRHLDTNFNHIDKFVVKRFPSFNHPDFAQFLDSTATYFVMCHDGSPTNAYTAHPAEVNNQAGRTDAGSLTSSSAHSLSSAEHLRRVNFRAMISWFITKQYNVALINELHFADTKVSHPTQAPGPN